MLRLLLPKFLLRCIEISIYFFGYILFVPVFLLLIVFSLYIRFVHKSPECIFIGLREVCTNAIDSIKALSKEYKVISFFAFFLHTSQHDNSLYNVGKIPGVLKKSDSLRLIYTKIYLICYFIYISIKCDKIIFFWSDSFLPLNLDYFLFYLMKKKVLVWYCGSDIRYAPIHAHLMKEFNFISNYNLDEKSSNLDFLSKFYKHKLAEKFCILHISREKGTFLKKSAIFFRTPFKLAVLEERRRLSVPIKICHIPSNRIVKNTDIVFQAIEILKQNTNIEFEFIFKEYILHAEVISILKGSDILVDYSGTIWGSLACEAMSYGCVVIGANEYNFEGLAPVPIIKFPLCPKYLASLLKRLIQNEKLLLKQMNKVRVYARNELSEEKYLKRIKEAFCGTLEKNVSPLPGIKNLLLKYAENKFQYWIIKLFF